MKIKNIIYLLTVGVFSACGQVKKPSTIKLSDMDTRKLTNTIIRQALDAWQSGDSEKWLSFFADNTQLLDDGSPRDFHKFSTQAIGHERFTSIDKVENEGLDIYGHFHSNTWGDFKTYFKFHINSDSEIYRLEIGQVNY
jgi:hypothetical protein